MCPSTTSKWKISSFLRSLILIRTPTVPTSTTPSIILASMDPKLAKDICQTSSLSLSWLIIASKRSPNRRHISTICQCLAAPAVCCIINSNTLEVSTYQRSGWLSSSTFHRYRTRVTVRWLPWRLARFHISGICSKNRHPSISRIWKGSSMSLLRKTLSFAPNLNRKKTSWRVTFKIKWYLLLKSTLNK